MSQSSSSCFLLGTSGIRTQGKGETKKKGRIWGFFIFFYQGGLVNADLREVFHTLGMWSKWIVRRRDSSGSLDRGSLDAHSQRHKHTCVAGMNITTYSPNDTQKHTSVHSFSSERSEALLRRWDRKYVSNTPLDPFVCTHNLTKNTHCLISKSFFFFFFYAQFSEWNMTRWRDGM